jgi:hypothetical protein
VDPRGRYRRQDASRRPEAKAGIRRASVRRAHCPITVITSRWWGSLEQTLGLWCDLADALVHPPAPTLAPKGMERLHDWLKPWMPRFLGLLYAASAAGEPADLDALTKHLLDEYEHRLPPGTPLTS